MTTAPLKQYYLSSRPRHLRYIYFITKEYPYEDLVKLMSKNQLFWGGRFNPVIPVIDGEVSEQYKNLLQCYDPDFIFYTSDIDLAYLRDLATYNPKDYITDDNGKLRDEFFLLCHSGFEENSQTFFLTSEMINSDFDIVKKSGINKFRISGTKILRNKKFLVKSKTNTLSRIERQIALSNFIRNREFISWKLPNLISNSDAILPHFNEPIDNSWGNIPNEFQKIKDNALKAMNEIETLYLDLKSIAEEVDPLEAFTKIEVLNSELGSQTYGHWGREIMESLYDEDFYYASKSHLDKVEHLRDDGLLDIFINLKGVIRKNISDFLCHNLPIDSNTIHSLLIEFSLEDFRLISIKHNLVKASEYFNVPETLDRFGHIEVPSSNYRGFKEVSNSCFEYYWLAGRIYIDEKIKDKLADFYRESDFWIYNDCIEKMYELKYCN